MNEKNVPSLFLGVSGKKSGYVCAGVCTQKDLIKLICLMIKDY